MRRIRYVVKRGRSVGTVLTPHLHEDNHYVVSLTRYEKDYQREKDEDALVEWVSNGYSIRMSNQTVKSHRSPSLITSSSIELHMPFIGIFEIPETPDCEASIQGVSKSKPGNETRQKTQEPSIHASCSQSFN